MRVKFIKLSIRDVFLCVFADHQPGVFAVYYWRVFFPPPLSLKRSFSESGGPCWGKPGPPTWSSDWPSLLTRGGEGNSGPNSRWLSKPHGKKEVGGGNERERGEELVNAEGNKSEANYPWQPCRPPPPEEGR